MVRGVDMANHEASGPETLREKIAQLLVVGFRGTTPAECGAAVRDVRDLGVGGVILFDREMAAPGGGRRNIVSPAQLQELTAYLRAQAARPLLVAIDQEGGRVNRLKPEYGFPESLSHEELGRLDRPEETFRRAEECARTLRAAGIDWNLAPVVDLDANPDNPIIKGKRRSFAADPAAVVRHAAEFVRAHRAHGVLTCLKHFPGHGSAMGDTHLGFVDVTTTWHERELEPFRQLVAADRCDAVMSAHVFNARLDPERPATLSRATIGGLLRERCGFRGVVTSDDMEMRAIAGRYGLEQALPEALNAGIDVLCFGNNLSYDPDIAPKAVAILERAVAAGTVTEARIEEAYGRVRALQRKAGVIA
jgi:beta-N-acetylhexosaminidase